MFECYTEQARRSLFFARYESSLLGSISIEPEHLLLGLLRERQDLVDVIPAPAADAIREQILRQTSERKPISTGVEIPFARETKRALETAASEADDLAHAHIGPEHLLLALATTPRTDAILKANGVEVSALRGQVRDRGAPTGRTPPVTPVNHAAMTPEARRAEMTRQLDAAIVFVRGIGDDHANNDEARRLIARICADLAALKGAIT